MPWNFQIQYSYLHSTVIMCIATFWQDNVSDNRQNSWFFNRGIDTVKIRALSNHKPGILKKTTLEWYIYIVFENFMASIADLIVVNIRLLAPLTRRQ
jgi:hypothetical protein